MATVEGWFTQMSTVGLEGRTSRTVMMSLKSLTPFFLSWLFLSSVDGFGLLLKRVIFYVAMMGGKGWDGMGWDGAKEERAKR